MIILKIITQNYLYFTTIKNSKKIMTRSYKIWRKLNSENVEHQAILVNYYQANWWIDISQNF